jgi:hypothetical protein
MENPRHLEHDKTKTIMGVEEEEQKQTKGTDNLFNRIIVEKFPNLEIKRVIQVHEATEHQTVKTKKKLHQTYHNQNIQYTEQRKNTENCKGEKTCHI